MRRKWAYPLKGRTTKQAMADALDGKLVGKSFCDDGFWQNFPVDICWNGVASWGHDAYCTVDWKIHSYDSMKDCLKYGFDIDTDGCLVAKDTDRDVKGREEK